MSNVLRYTEELVTENCCTCAMTFAVPSEFQKRRQDDKRAFYCPSGHSMSYLGKSEADKLRDELTRERARLDQAKAEAERLRGRVALRERQVAARKAVATKLRKRISVGKCPCCHAQFTDLKQHMQTQHPKWDPEKAAEALGGAVGEGQ